MRTYFTLCERGDDGVWRAEFGDYDRETVEAERADYRDHGKRAKTLKIVRSGDTQAEIEAAVKELNAAEPRK